MTGRNGRARQRTRTKSEERGTKNEEKSEKNKKNRRQEKMTAHVIEGRKSRKVTKVSFPAFDRPGERKGGGRSSGGGVVETERRRGRDVEQGEKKTEKGRGDHLSRSLPTERTERSHQWSVAGKIGERT